MTEIITEYWKSHDYYAHDHTQSTNSLFKVNTLNKTGNTRPQLVEPDKLFGCNTEYKYISPTRNYMNDKATDIYLQENILQNLGAAVLMKYLTEYYS